MSKNTHFYQFDLTNGISVRVEALSFSHAISRIEFFIDNIKIHEVKSIHNIDINVD